MSYFHSDRWLPFRSLCVCESAWNSLAIPYEVVQQMDRDTQDQRNPRWMSLNPPSQNTHILRYTRAEYCREWKNMVIYCIYMNQVFRLLVSLM